MIMSNYNQLDPDMFNSSDCKHPELSILSCLRSKMCLRKEILLIQANTVKYWIGHSRSRDQTPYNSACDVLIRGLINLIPESDMFQANAAFRESARKKRCLTQHSSFLSLQKQPLPSSSIRPTQQLQSVLLHFHFELLPAECGPSQRPFQPYLCGGRFFRHEQDALVPPANFLLMITRLL
ncbi:hypothetical protein TIFTF001_021721 [Ficus carica]|uniref:Uncharacterized protein n=1 Tax=Ficus carica TaxID=3494 RepID=A0AA88DB07_FICCA|nr:hypothetical protein TIFTF001_021721 [Ficus carica]